jgi:putative transposase
MSTTPAVPDLSAVSPQHWDEARRRLPIIRELLEHPTRTRAQVIAAAAAIGRGPTQTYSLLRRYQADPRLTSLLPLHRGPVRGFSRLSPEVEALIDEAIESLYLSQRRPRVSDLLTQVRKRCYERGLIAPGRKAIDFRLRAKPLRERVARREGSKAARDRFAPATGSLEASWPLSLIQIDHTLVDVIVVDANTRTPIQRPWLTLAIDVCSRCMAGFYLSLEAPSATSVALCIAHAGLPKEAWLAERRIEACWPVQGLFAKLHLDNATEFRSEALTRGCEQYGIAIDYRPVRTPHYGGHIERLIGTMMGKVHLLPGSTFSSVHAKGNLDPAKSAAMTLEELERWIGHAIAGVYHRTIHSALGTTPLAAWERGISGDTNTPGRGDPVAIPDPRRFLVDFLPLARRLIRREGVALHRIGYWSDVLHTWIGEPHKMVVRYDPRDLSRIYLLAPDKQYYELPYCDLSRPPISLSEHRLALKRLREEGRAHVDEAAIFRAIEEMRVITEAAVNTSKTARRRHERHLRLLQGGKADNAPADQPSAPPLSVVPDPEVICDPTHLLPVEEWS